MRKMFDQTLQAKSVPVKCYIFSQNWIDKSGWSSPNKLFQTVDVAAQLQQLLRDSRRDAAVTKTESW